MPLVIPCVSCGELVPKSPCPECSESRSKARKYKPIRRDSFYRTTAWRRLSRACRARDRNLCQACGARGKIAHHIDPRENGGPDVLENLVCLCQTCHNEITAQIRNRQTTALRTAIEGI